jgi:hypothetical protein
MIRTEIVWLDNSKRKGKPIRRRWCLYLGERRVLTIPLRPVAWSR